MDLSFKQLFSPYLALTLSAFENAKLVVAVLNEAGQSWQAFEITQIGEPTPFYAICWQQQWVVCGKVNDYNVSIVAANDTDICSKKSINVPVLNMQQVSFMCMENSHFDHC